MKLEFSQHIFETSSSVKFYQNLSSGDELFHANGRADMTKLIDAFRNFANEPKNCVLI
jgi:hypothetical protein